ncbi:electron transfer flavoprotein subunit beta/FixA family protein [Candidatus Magnetaquicoccus inordinatus]|uniref:electron transfer flavoprotein subunit beta/FixA family protein n=1 Tax=Candidatus Magnetaquicoccus inordinatus TaxID=2496818 RepID=UPI00102C61C0|nr:electron transfer flavoprotein subunit beta/FixA family protein [Candidatus Magnetaquicoccus inordinatus]
MKILVAIKPVCDPTQPLPLHSSAAERAWPPATRLNPFDEVALEAALRWRDSGSAEWVQVISVGPNSWENHLRTALAMGADQAVLLQTATEWPPLLVAKGLAAAARHLQVDLLLCGRQSVDRNHNQTGPMSAALLAWGQMTQATRLEPQGDALLVERELEGVRECWLLPLPAVVTVDWGLNGISENGGIRYASLPNLVKARRKTILRFTPEQWQLPDKEENPLVQTLSWQLPAPRSTGQRLTSLPELHATLRQQGLLAESGPSANSGSI